MKVTQLYRKHNVENSVTGEVNGRVSAAEHTQLHWAFCLAAEQSGHKPHRLCCLKCSAARCVQSSIVGLEDLKYRVRTCWASLDQQLINKAIDQWWPRLKTLAKVHGGHIEQLFTWLSCCCMKFSLFYLVIYASTYFHLYFTIVI